MAHGSSLRPITTGLGVIAGLIALLFSRVYAVRRERERYGRLQELLDNDPYL